MKKELLAYSFENKLGHIPSAMSMIDYLDVLFTGKFVTPDDHILLGKPFGAQAYYLVWRKLGYLTEIEQLSAGVKHDEVSFVDYSEETMGNALGIAAGIAMTTDKKVWVNLSDATLQMGNTLEAIQFIGQHRLKNIFVTIDYNNAQVTGRVDDILTVSPVLQLFKGYGWTLQEVDGHDKLALEKTFKGIDNSNPTVVVCHTLKGHGIKEIEEDIRKWHYKQIETLTELQSLVAELRAT
jgi:transketolase